VHAGRLVNDIKENGGKVTVTLDDGKTIETDHVGMSSFSCIFLILISLLQ
jgi:hypothetical protein